ncbi:hypothetical protein A7979_09270 [Rothia nasimurium]|uniref:Uncharacterized protein n=1 Tax=Rothia nasimurium TaxID=85336 RepID=A0A1Y1RSE1_9MICC|nr:hypothetical protein [Rothia nasimurium]ORC25012.1 hypothetical protein A7979_09270 [Rothia nasimurium]
MKDLWANNWQEILILSGISGAGVIITYFWRRWVRWHEKSDLESRKDQLDKVKDLVNLRKEIQDKDGPEALLVTAILKTTVATELLLLSKQINRGNRTIKYIVNQFLTVLFGATLVIMSSLIASLNDATGWKIFGLVAGIFVALLASVLYTSAKAQRKASIQFISSAITKSNDEETINTIIDLALSGEQFVEDRGDWRGAILGEKVIKEKYRHLSPTDKYLVRDENNPSQAPTSQNSDTAEK